MNPNPVSHLTEEEAKELHSSRRREVQERSQSHHRAARSLFMSDAECRLRAQAHSEATRHGVVNHHQIKRHADAIIANLAPVLAQNILSGQEAVELRKGQVQGPLSAAESSKRMDEFVKGLRTPIYGTAARVEVRATEAKQKLHQNPALRQMLNTGNAANSVPLGRSLLRRVWSEDKR